MTSCCGGDDAGRGELEAEMKAEVEEMKSVKKAAEAGGVGGERERLTVRSRACELKLPC